jgi:hypothetical protein
MTQQKEIKDAIEFISEKLGDVDNFRIDYYTTNHGEAYITIHCDQPIEGVEQSRLDKYKLESIELGQSATVVLKPQKV